MDTASLRYFLWLPLTALLPLGGCMGDGAAVGARADGGPSSSPPPSSGYADAGAPARGADTSEPTTSEPTDESDGDEYEAPGTNPFTRTGHDPFSTFAADVDTASYDIFVRDVTDGYLPQQASVRLEEYVNFFDYGYEAPEPGAEVPFNIELSAAQHPMGRQLAQLRVGIQAEEAPPFEKKPTNLVFLIDVSGSMSDSDKLPVVKHLLARTTDVLDQNDTVSIVTYASGTGVRLEPTAAGKTDEIQAALDSLTASGSTAGGDGIDLAYGQAEAGFIEDGFNHVILCTDGDFNVGPSSDEALVELIEEKRESGITLTALGFGRGNLNDSMMEKVSNAGNGIYSVISSEEHASRYAEENILQTVHHVAKDMKIQLELNPEHVVAYRLLGYENRAIADEDFRDDAVDAGEVGAGHRVTALYELVLEGQTVPEAEGAPEVVDGEPAPGDREVAADELVRVKVRWKELGASEEDPASEVTESLTPADVVEELDAAADDDFLWASAIAAFAEILKDSPYADTADLDRIEAIVGSQADRDRDRGEFVDLFHETRRLMGEAER